MSVQTELLAVLQATEGFVSGGELSRKLSISRTAVWKHIRKLEQRGYRFEALPRVGYRLVAEPQTFRLEAFEEALRTERFGRCVKYMEAATSTQDVMKEWAASGAAEGSLALAESQTAGRGRQGKAWFSPPYSGIWMSLALKPDVSVQAIPQLTLLTAVALCRTVRRVTGVDAGIKWPNDLLAGGKKISGILLESVAEDERVQVVIAGIGISVNVEEADYPADVGKLATSLKAEAGRPVSRERLLAEFLNEYETLYDAYLHDGFGAVRALWEALSVTIGRTVRVWSGHEAVEGTAVGIEESGALRMKLADGSERLVYSGEVER